jgi:hypothetical protein
MKRYIRVICWSILLTLSIIALIIASVDRRNVQLLPSIIAVPFTAIFAVVEYRKIRKTK